MKPTTLFLFGFLTIGGLPTAPVTGQEALPDLRVEWRWADYGRETGFGGRRVRQMLEVGDTLWALTDEGVFWFDQFSWHLVAEGEGLPPGRPGYLSVSAKGDLLLVQEGRVFRGNAREFGLLTPTGFDYGRYHALRAVESPRGLLVSAKDMAEDRNLLFLWTRDTVQEFPTPGVSQTPWRLWPVSSGKIWLGGGPGLFFLGEDGWERLSEPSPEPYRFEALWESPDGDGFASQIIPLETRGLLTWSAGGSLSRLPSEGEYTILSGITGSDGLTLVVYDSGDLRTLSPAGWSTQVLPPHRGQGLHFVYEDRRGDLWFASQGGLHLFKRSVDRWSEIRFPFPDPRNRVNDLLVTRDGAFWMATHGGLARIRDDGTQLWIHEILGTPLGPVTGLGEDAEGGVWVTSGASFEGAYRYHENRWTKIGAQQGLLGGRIHRVALGTDGSLWLLGLGTSWGKGGGVFRWKGGRAERFVDERGWLEGSTYAMAEGPQGTLWFGTARGAARFDGSSWSYWSPAEDLASGIDARVFTILPTEEGGALLGFGAQAQIGLMEIRSDGSAVDLSEEAGLVGVGVTELARDPEGVLWAASDRGVFRRSDGAWSVFDGTAGLNPEAAWPLEFREGEVLIGTTGGGLQILNRAEEENPPPKIELMGPVTTKGKTFRVRWRSYGFRGELPPGQVENRDRLPGEDWSGWGGWREIWPGEDEDYGWGPKTVQIQAKGLFGQMSVPLHVEFEVPLPVHLQPLFYLPVSALGVAVLVLLVLGYRRRLRTAEAIRESEATLRMMVDTAPEGIAIFDADEDRFVDVNANLMAMTGRTREGSLATPLGGSSPDLTVDGKTARQYLLERVEEALSGKTVTFGWTLRATDGSWIPTQMQVVRFPSSKGRRVRFSVMDISERKAAEEKREDLEAQLRQSQKLEAVGQLTGGVAHDFNNLLTVIMGNLDLLREWLEGDPEAQELLDGAMSAAERSALLTQRLLAFSRRQALDSKPIVLMELVEGLKSLLQRSLGETIRVHTRIPRDLWVVSADPGQLEHAVINLCVNARDAMQEGGDLYLEGSNVVVEPEVAAEWEGAPGEYVCFSVTDTGVGMDAQVRARAIDPFFTTKGVGEGSGLGLSMVYGFVRQSGGFIKIYSEPGRGTVVQLLLPRVEGAVPLRELPEGKPGEAPRGQGETILLVEDEPLLLKLSTRICQNLGYQVISATDARSALDLVRGGGGLDLLFSDVVLPGGMDGIQLALQARKFRPGLPVLFTSGYAEESILKMAREIPDFELVPKPFDSGSLSSRIRSVLDRSLSQQEQDG